MLVPKRGVWEASYMDKLSERRGTLSQAYTPSYKTHIKLGSTGYVKAGLSSRAVTSKKYSEVLSPLVLSPYEEIESSGCPFTLEEPPKKEEKHSSREAKLERNRNLGMSGRVKLHRSNQEMHAGSSNTYLAGIMKDWKPQNFLMSSSSTSKRTSQGSVLCAWDVSSSDEIDYGNYLGSLHSLPWSSVERQHHGESSLGSGEVIPNLQKGPFARSQHDFLRPNAICLHSPFPEKCMPYVTGEGSSCSEDGTNTVSILNGKVADSAIIVAQPSFVDQHVLASGMELAIAADQGSSRNLSQKFRPRIFEDLVGQDLVVQALSSAVMKGKVAPVYLFHGSRGTGKTSTARILAAALNCCMTDPERRPCTRCSQCKTLALGKSSSVCEVDAASHNGVNHVYTLVQRMLVTSPNSRYKVFIIDECHMLTEETWNALLYFLEEPPGDLVFVLITTDADSVPCTASSRCQKFFFMKVKHSDILKRLSKLVTLEGIDVEHGALDLIASQADGSMRDAEMTLDQLSLSGHRITFSAVLDLVGPLSVDDKLLNLLNLSLGSDTVKTVQKAKELVDSGVEPLDLMRRLARLIMDILAGSHKVVGRNRDDFILTQMGSKEGLEGLSGALKILLEAEKQVKAVHHDRMAWLTAALLQLGPYQHHRVLLPSTTNAAANPAFPLVSKNLKWNVQKGNHRMKWANTGKILNKTSPYCNYSEWTTTSLPKARKGKPNLEARIHPSCYPLPADATQEGYVDSSSEGGSSPYSSKGSEKCTSLFGPGNLGSLWINILKGCKSLPLRHLLSHGRLLAVCFSTVEAMVHLEFKDPEQKSRAERYRMVIANTCKKWLGLSVNVKISLACEPRNELNECRLSPLLLLAEQKQEHKSYLDESLQPFVLEELEPAKSDKIEKGSFRYWQGQSERNTLGGFDYPAYNGPFDRASLSRHTKQILDRSPPFVSDQYLCISDAVLGKETQGIAGMFDELGAAKTNCWQVLPCQQEDQGNLSSFSKSADGQAVSKLKSETEQPAQWTPSLAPIRNDENKDNGSIERCKQESKSLGSQIKYKTLFCWRVPSHEEKSSKRRKKRRCRAFITHIPCGRQLANGICLCRQL